MLLTCIWMPLNTWRHTPVQAFAGIAKPEVFFAMLRAQGLALVCTQALPDHADLQDLHIDASQGDVMCTEKDAVKLWAQPSGLGRTASNDITQRTAGRYRPAFGCRATRKVIITLWTPNCLNFWSAP